MRLLLTAALLVGSFQLLAWESFQDHRSLWGLNATQEVKSVKREVASVKLEEAESRPFHKDDLFNLDTSFPVY